MYDGPKDQILVNFLLILELVYVLNPDNSEGCDPLKFITIRHIVLSSQFSESRKPR